MNIWRGQRENDIIRHMEELDYNEDTFEDIRARDRRYDAKAYTLLSTAFHTACKSGNASTEDILDEFKETALDQFGPMTFHVLDSWGVHECMDIGEMMMNLVESGRIGKSENDNYEDFRCGYDFREAFLGPYDAY